VREIDLDDEEDNVGLPLETFRVLESIAGDTEARDFCSRVSERRERARVDGIILIPQLLETKTTNI
jgi:hypothetical protein